MVLAIVLVGFAGLVELSAVWATVRGGGILAAVGMVLAVPAAELAVTLLITLAACRFYLHMLQLESYQLDGYMRWLKREKNRQFGWTLNAASIATLPPPTTATSAPS